MLPTNYKSFMPAIFFAILAITFVLAACNTASAESATTTEVETTPEPVDTEEVTMNGNEVFETDYPEVAVIAADYTFAAPGGVEAGLVMVTLENQGQEPHQVQLARLNDGVTIAEFQEALQAGPEALGLVTWAGGVAAVDPGDKQSVTVDLTPGTYLLLCFLPDHEGTPHLALGQLSSFEVGEPSPEKADVALPQAVGVVKMLDFAYILPSTIKAGPQVWEIVNAGEQPHEIALIKLAGGKTLADAQAFMANPHGTPPFRNIGGLQGIDPGETGWLNIDLTPGTYAAICHIPDPASGHTHSELGMVVPFSVK
ncbi:MAG: hypothetical protein KDJ52_13235 [Anaerolineae bacterium]|nr:hypothetical protein [Anaerolineae bacterium]